MSGDYSRERFDPQKHFESVLMQQGRVQLDADWNDWAAMIARRMQATTLDTVGRVAVPRAPADALGPTGFRIEAASASGFNIGPGRAYVDGLLAENPGTEPQFDTRLAEPAGSAALAYVDQPYRRNLQPLSLTAGTHLAYLDVWRREVGPLQSPDLVEPALGVDTTTRTQIAWQVRVLENLEAGDCAEVREDPAWQALSAAPAARLSTAATGVANVTDPCLIPPSGGYKGLENRLYRVEIHDGNSSGTATLKWSRDNATVASLITEVAASLDAISVESLGRDAILAFQPGDWIEITDDEHEFERTPGAIRRIVEVDPATRRLTLNTALPAGVFLTTPKKPSDPPPQLRAIRWNQSGRVLDSDGNLLVDLDDPAADGLIPVQIGTAIVLEDGVEITLDLDPAGGPIRSGDYWTFAARVADASVEPLDRAAPRGIHHHYASLALLDVNVDGIVTSVSDCRVFWPPEAGATADCACTVCVSAEDHNSNILTIQQAIDRIAETGGSVCLGPGEFFIRNTINALGTTAVRVRGHGMSTRLMLTGAGPLMRVQEAMAGFTLEDLMFYSLPQPNRPNVTLLELNGGEQIVVRRCAFLFDDASVSETAIAMLGRFDSLLLADNTISAPLGIVMPAGLPTSTTIVTSQLRIADNALLCRNVGIDLGSPESQFIGTTALHRNQLAVEAGDGLRMVGRTGLDSRLDICGNYLQTSGNGLRLSANAWAVRDNVLVSSPNPAAPSQAAAVLVEGQDGLVLDGGVISGNQIRGYGGAGVALGRGITSLDVCGNDFARLGAGISMNAGSSAAQIRVRDNRFTDIALDFNSEGQQIAAIDLQQVSEASLSGNLLRNVATGEGIAELRAGIRLRRCRTVFVQNNELVNIGPATGFSGLTWAIAVLDAELDAQIAGNRVRRSETGVPSTDGDASDWIGIFVGSADSAIYAEQVQLSASGASTVNGQQVTSAVLRLVQRGLLPVPVGLMGNRVHGYGQTPAIVAWSAANLQCSDNRCIVSATRQQASLWLAAGSLSATANHASCQTENLTIWLFARDAGSFTALGNLVSRTIWFNAASLGNPWLPLNAQL